MKYICAFMLLCCLFLVLHSCSVEAPSPENIKNIDAVFVHDPQKISFLVDGKLKTHQVNPANITFVFDVKEGKAWAEIKINKFSDEIITVHMHSPEDFKGAGWNHGKITPEKPAKD